MLFLGDLSLDRLLLRFAQPLGVTDAVVKEEKDCDAEQDCWNRFDQEHPLPASKAVAAMERIHDPARKRITENPRDGDRGHEYRDDLGAPMRGIPVGEEEDDAGVETSLGDTEQEAQQVEHRGRCSEHETG